MRLLQVLGLSLPCFAGWEQLPAMVESVLKLYFARNTK
jgi:hypothetical protein